MYKINLKTLMLNFLALSQKQNKTKTIQKEIQSINPQIPFLYMSDLKKK